MKIIYEKDAIDALHKTMLDFFKTNDDDKPEFITASEKMLLSVNKAISKALKALPSAQPEQLERCPIYDGVCGYPSDQCYDCPRHHGAQPEQRWIPCSERLPEDLEEVNITWVNHEPESYYADIKDKHYTASAVYYRGKWYWYSAVCVDYLAEYGTNYADEMDEAIEVTAWKPLPEPYTEDNT